MRRKRQAHQTPNVYNDLAGRPEHTARTAGHVAPTLTHESVSTTTEMSLVTRGKAKQSPEAVLRAERDEANAAMARMLRRQTPSRRHDRVLQSLLRVRHTFAWELPGAPGGGLRQLPGATGGSRELLGAPETPGSHPPLLGAPDFWSPGRPLGAPPGELPGAPRGVSGGVSWELRGGEGVSGGVSWELPPGSSWRDVHVC